MTRHRAVPRDVPRRPARRQKSMAWELAKIVGGAILAVPAAQIILWWFVPYDWKRDLLGSARRSAASCHGLCRRNSGTRSTRRSSTRPVSPQTAPHRVTAEAALRSRLEIGPQPRRRARTGRRRVAALPRRPTPSENRRSPTRPTPASTDKRRPALGGRGPATARNRPVPVPEATGNAQVRGLRSADRAGAGAAGECELGYVSGPDGSASGKSE